MKGNILLCIVIGLQILLILVEVLTPTTMDSLLIMKEMYLISHEKLVISFQIFLYNLHCIDVYSHLYLYLYFCIIFSIIDIKKIRMKSMVLFTL